MLVKYVSFFVFLLMTVSWASSSDNGEDFAFHFAQVGEALIDEALNTPEISSQLTSSSHAILSSIATKNEYAMRYYNFAVQSYDFRNLGFDSVDPKYWNAFISYPFREFSCQQRDQAQIIVNEIVLPHHPFLAQVPFRFHTADFLDQDQRIFDIDFFLDKVAYNNFSQEFSQILALDDPSEAHILLKALLHKAKNTSFPDLDFKYHHAFIANAPFQYLRRIRYSHEHHKNINSFISQLAPTLYSEIAEDSKQLADKILAGLIPSIYSKLTDTSYEIAIRKYQESLLQPIDKSYFWDPQQLLSDILEALQAFSIVEKFNLRPYIKIIEFLVDDSPLAYLFRHYIAQNFCKPSNLPPQHKPIVKLFLQGRTDITTYDVGLALIWASEGGHVPVVEYLLYHRDNIPIDYVGKALECATIEGHIAIVELLLQRRARIPADHVFQALRFAAKGGYTAIVELLLYNCDDISAYHVGFALCDAAESGYTHVVELLLQIRTDINAYDAGIALGNASKGGHTSIVESLLHHRNDIPNCFVGVALCDAAKRGDTPFVERILRRNDTPNCHVGLALIWASEGGHAPVVKCLLYHRNYIRADDIGCALRTASEGSHTAVVELLLQSRIKIYDYYAGLALSGASECGYTSVVELLLQSCTGICASNVSSALIMASEGGHITVVERLLYYRDDILSDDVGRALCDAAKGGHTPIVELLLQSRIKIYDYYAGLAFRVASESGHIPVVELLGRHHLNMNR
jgi:ankyrin repeat protein